MTNRSLAMLAGLTAVSAVAFVQPASALTMQECSTKYKAAQDADAVGSMSWNEFRKAECGAGATMTVKKAKAIPSKAAPATEAAGPSLAECSTRYKAAKSDGALGSMTWNEFRKAGCVAEATVAPAPKAKQAAANAASSGNAAVSEQECSVRYQAAKGSGKLGGMTWNEFRKAGCPTAIVGPRTSLLSDPVYPNSVAKKYAGESSGRARLLTCRDQYNANKAAGRTELKWTEEGGGYYSECNKRLSARD